MDGNTKTSEFALLVSAGAHDPLEEEVRQRVRGFIEAILEEELQAVLGRGRYEDSAEGARGRRFLGPSSRAMPESRPAGL